MDDSTSDPRIGCLVMIKFLRRLSNVQSNNTQRTSGRSEVRPRRQGPARDALGSRRSDSAWAPRGPTIAALILVIGVIAALVPSTPSPNGRNVLIGPGNLHLHIQKTSDDLGSFTPYTPGELWGGTNPVEQCLPCELRSASGQPAGQSIQPGQQVNPATGDFTFDQNLFSVPAAGSSLGVSAVYDAEQAQWQLDCIVSRTCHGATTWPDFGWGWKSDAFPYETTWTDGSGTTWIQVSEPNGSQATFQGIGGGTMCPQGGLSSPSNYTLIFSVQNFCAAYRVKAYISLNSDGSVGFAANGARTTVNFSMYGTPEVSGNIANAALLTYDSVGASPGSPGCPSTAATGSVAGCYLITDTAGRITSVVYGMPTSNTTLIGVEVLKVIDPGGFQSYDISWEPPSVSVFDEPSSIIDSATTTGANFAWTADGTGFEDDMTKITPLNAAAAPGESVGYNGYGSVTSTSDDSGANTTYYSYSDPSCAPCLSSGDLQTTTVSYPDGETDVDSYDEGILESNTYGAGIAAQTVTYSVSYPSYPTDQDGPISETFSGPASGQETVAQTDGVGDLTYLKDSEGNQFTSMYDLSSILDELCWSAPGDRRSDTCSTPPSGVATVYGYDSNGYVTSAKDPLGNKTRYGYNTDEMICWVAPPTVTASGSACGAVGAAPTHVPAGGTAYQYDLQGDLACVFVADGKADQTTAYAEYDIDGEMTEYDPPDAIGFGSFTCGSAIPNPSYGTTYTFTNGQLITKTAPNSQVTTNTYTNGLLEEQVDPTGKTTNAYDADGRECWTARASTTASVGTPPFSCGGTAVGSKTGYQYIVDTTRRWKVTNPRGNTTIYTYGDTAYPSLPTVAADPDGTSVVYTTYDANGNMCDTGTVETTSCYWTAGDEYDTYDGLFQNVASTTDAFASTDIMIYTHTNPSFPSLVTSITDPLGTNTWNSTYDADGRLHKTTDPSGNVVSVQYDADSRRCWQAVVSSAAGCGGAPSGQIGDSSWTYNANGTLSTMSDNLGTSQAASTNYTYDAQGNETSVDDDNGNTVEYSYNASGRVSCVGYPGTTMIVTNCSGTASPSNPIVTYQYDSENRLYSTTDWLGHTISYVGSADGLNNLTTINYPTTSPDSVTYGYNADGQVNSQNYGGTSLSGIPNQSWGYNNDDLVDSSTQLNSSGGTISSYTSSPTYTGSIDHNWIAGNTNPGASGADTFGYAANGKPTSDAPPSGSPMSFGYNADSELCWTLSGTSANACGSPPAGATTYTSTPDGQRCWSAPSSIGSATCSSPPSSGATGYAWNAYGELCWSGTISTTPTCGSPPGSGVTKYSYDGEKHRIRETSPSGASQDFTWGNSSANPVLLQDGTNAYIYGPVLFGGSAPVEQINLSTGAVSYLTSAPSGVQLVLNQSGSVQNESSYSTFGVQSNSSGAATPFGFSGAYTDPSGLVFLLNRYYDPKTEQFISVDPKVAQTGQPYSYAGDDPVNGCDPNGLSGTISQQAQDDLFFGNVYLQQAVSLLQQALGLLDEARWLLLGAWVSAAQGNSAAAQNYLTGAGWCEAGAAIDMSEAVTAATIGAGLIAQGTSLASYYKKQNDPCTPSATSPPSGDTEGTCQNMGSGYHEGNINVVQALCSTAEIGGSLMGAFGVAMLIVGAALGPLDLLVAGFEYSGAFVEYGTYISSASISATTGIAAACGTG